MPDKVLIVDDDAEFRLELKDALDEYSVLEVSSGKDAINLLKKANEIGVVVLDVMMPGVSGLDVLTEIKKTDPQIGIIILTGHSSKDVAIEALKGRADDYIEKPVDLEKLKQVIEKLLEAQRSKKEAETGDIEGKIEKVKRFIERNCFKKTTLTDAAAAVCLSPKYLSRIFKENAKAGFNEYKLKIKVAKAKELLNKSGYNINQISDKLGYENAESFIRQFKKLTGSTPSVFRKRLKAKKRKA
jgi:two-component system, response regulator YesN